MVDGIWHYLFFPQWQGAVWADLKAAALAIRQRVDGIDWRDVQVKDFHRNLVKEDAIWGKTEILQQFQHAHNLLDNDKPDKIATLGGGCDVDALVVSYLNQVYQNELQVLWLDAHADLNTPKSSPSGALHGMPVRMLLGEGDRDLQQSLFSTLRPNQIIFAGVRDVDAPEQNFIDTHRIVSLAAEQLNAASVLAHLDNNRPLYIHLDLDVLDPQEFPCVACPTKSGATVDQLMQLLDKLVATFNVVGMSLLECCHDQCEPSDSTDLLSKLDFPFLLKS